MIIGIVAIAKNFAIGKDGKLPWHYSADLKFFKQTTVKHTVVMGWNTWASIGKPLPKRLNIVLTRKKNLKNQPSVLLMRSRKEVLALAEFLNCDLFLIGGAETYKTFAGKIEKWIVTEIPLEVENADAFMPKDFLGGFDLRQTIELEKDLHVKFFERK